jgi:hypothetical protein
MVASAVTLEFWGYIYKLCSVSIFSSPHTTHLIYLQKTQYIPLLRLSCLFKSTKRKAMASSLVVLATLKITSICVHGHPKNKDADSMICPELAE